MKSAIANEYQPGRWGGKVWVVEGKERGIERERRTGKDRGKDYTQCWSF